MSPGNCSWRPHSDPLKSKWRGAELEPKGYKKILGGRVKCYLRMLRRDKRQREARQG